MTVGEIMNKSPGVSPMKRLVADLIFLAVVGYLLACALGLASLTAWGAQP